MGRPDYALALAGGSLADLPADWLESGDTVIALADDSGCLALFRIGDQVRPEANALVASLLRTGRHVVLLSGDAEPVARRVAAELSIDEVYAGVSPQGKHQCVQRLQAGGACGNGRRWREMMRRFWRKRRYRSPWAGGATGTDSVRLRSPVRKSAALALWLAARAENPARHSAKPVVVLCL